MKNSLIFHNTKLLIFLINAFYFKFCLCTNDYHYDYLSYDNVISTISDFAIKYPQYIRMYNVTDQNVTFPLISSCGSQK